MSNDFWWGMATIPLVILAICVAAAAITGLIWLSANFRVNEYKLLKRSEEYNRPNLAATIACAKWVRYCWIPGWHLILCRSTIYNRAGGAIEKRHSRVGDAVRKAVNSDHDK